jgi:hypothetical protein
MYTNSMPLDNFLEGLSILRKHYVNPDGHFGTDTRGFHADKTSWPLSKVDVERLKTLGWCQLEKDGCLVHEYRPNLGWTACFNG